MRSLSITKTTKKPSPFKGKKDEGFLEKIKSHVLGKNFSVSLVFIGNERSKALNKKYRNKNHPTNVLSFPLGKNEAEIFVNTPLSGREARLLGVSARKHALHLFIHGLLHLKGFEHGSTMEKKEQVLLKKFSPDL